MKIQWPLTVLGALLLCGCARIPPSGTIPGPARVRYGTISLFSDPPGAHVYGGGEYYGETAPVQPVTLTWDKADTTTSYVLVLKKRGYKTTTYPITVRLEFATKEEALRNPRKVVVVMDTE